MQLPGDASPFFILRIQQPAGKGSKVSFSSFKLSCAVLDSHFQSIVSLSQIAVAPLNLP